MKQPRLSHGPLLPIAIVVLSAILAALWLTGVYREHDATAILLPDAVVRVVPDPKPLTAFSLVDHEGRAFDLASLRGKWTFLFFGFTHCPDICPTTLAVLARVRAELAEHRDADEATAFVFVSVDPQRDSALDLARYVTHFDPQLRGVTGEAGQIATLAAQLGAAYAVEFVPGAEDYPVSHTTALFLVDPQARLHAVFAPPLDAATISTRFEGLRRMAKRSAL